MSYDPGPLDTTVFVLPEMRTARALSRFQENVASWVDRMRRGVGWTDLRGSAQDGLSSSALTNQEVPAGSDFLLPCMHSGPQEDDISFVYQFPHHWNKTTVHPHLHVMPLAPAGGTFAIAWKYQWLGIGAKLVTFPALQVVKKTFTASDQYEQKILELGEITPPADLSPVSAHLLIYVKRSVADDTYSTSKGWGVGATNVAVLDADVHYRARLFGTATEYL